MLYFDYSATTPVDKKVLKAFVDYSTIKQDLYLEELAKNKIQKLLKTNMDVLFTSGSTESNNQAICGILNKYNEKGSHIITTKLEHSSINECLAFYEKKGFIIDYVNLIDGQVDLSHLKSLITEKTVLVTIASVNSETGLLQPIKEIGRIIKEHENIIFHSDMTQSIGKVEVDLSECDLVSFSAHKFYGLKGIGVLLKNPKINLIPILYGTRTTNLPLIRSLQETLELALDDLKGKQNFIQEMNNYLKENLKKYPNISINSNGNCIPHILNISILKHKPETFLHKLETKDIYVSTKSACSSTNDYSKAVYELTKDMKKAQTSIRISISHLTKKKDINELLQAIEVFANE